MNVGGSAASLLIFALLYLHGSALVALVKAHELTAAQMIFQACLVWLVPVFGPLLVLHLLRESDPERRLRTRVAGIDLPAERNDTPADPSTTSQAIGETRHHGAHDSASGEGHGD
jgi:hypothetical protein